MEKRPRLLAHLTALMVTTIWGSTFVSSKVLLSSGLDAADIFFMRFILAYIGLCAIAPKKLLCDNMKDELCMLILGISGGSLYFLTENMALKYSLVSNVSIIVGSCPLLTMIILSIFYKSERMRKVQVLGSIIAFLGMALVVLNGQIEFHLSPIGDALAFSAAICWATYSLFMRRVMYKYDTTFTTRKIFFYGLVSILPYFLLVSPLKTDMSILTDLKVWMNLVFLGIVASLICFVLWNWVMKELGPILSTNYIYLNPLVAIVFAAVILGEPISLAAILGAGLLITGLALAEKSR